MSRHTIFAFLAVSLFALASCRAPRSSTALEVPADCSWERANVLLSGEHVYNVAPIRKQTNEYTGDDDETVGVTMTLNHSMSAAHLEEHLRCYAARVDRARQLPLDTPLDVSVHPPEVTVDRKGGYLVVSIVAESARDGERILASAKLLGERARKRVGSR